MSLTTDNSYNITVAACLAALFLSPLPARGLQSQQGPAPYLIVLGNAQDGGVPQPGSPERGYRRLATSLALVDPASGGRWLFEASPHLPEQLARLDSIAPRGNRRAPGLDGVFLTHAHIGHYVGLMYLGHEVMGAQGVPVYLPPRMARYLESNGPWSQLVNYRNIELNPLALGDSVELTEALWVHAFLVPHRQEYSEVVGYRIVGPERSVMFIPDIDSWEDWDAAGVGVEQMIAQVDVAYLDGTFFDDGEVPGRDMSGFPHPRISHSIERFSPLPASERSKIRFIHLNHTNPAHDPDGEERRLVLQAGMAVAQEGEVYQLASPAGSSSGDQR